MPATVTTSPESALVLRPAHETDTPAVRRLAALDDARVPREPVLLALIDEQPVAALSLADGHVVATPFALTDTVVMLLRMRGEQLAGGDRPSRTHRRPNARFARAAA